MPLAKSQGMGKAVGCLVASVGAALLLTASLALADESHGPAFARLVDLDGPRNLRDLGGYETKDGRFVRWGKVYRSDNLANLTDADKAKLRQRDIRTVIDFRSNVERSMAETSWTGEGVPRFVLLPIGGTTGDWSASLARFLRTGAFEENDFHNTFLNMYRAIPAEATAEYRFLFDAILADNGAVLFHCTAGKDRTGIATALILGAIGVPRQTIMDDYMLTNAAVNAEGSAVRMAEAFGARYGRDIRAETMFPLVGVAPVYLETMYIVIDRDYGSIERYLNIALTLSTEELTTLKSLLLTDKTN